MNILVTGSSGLIGAALMESFGRQGHTVTPYRRAQLPAFDRFDAVVHLAGENIAGRWTEAKKRRIRESRIGLTRPLSEAAACAARPPRAFLCASAIGIYGDRAAESLNEDSPRGTGFLADVVAEWEQATTPASDAGIRVANLRFGVVLDAERGALARMLLPFRLGAGGIIGSGQQFWSWIALPDAVGAIEHALMTESARGPINIVSPQPVTNHEFTKTLGRVLRRPTIIPLPAVVARLALGEMADALLLSSARVYPSRLQQLGYEFRYSHLEEALRYTLGCCDRISA
jgi:uncharacterized protein (TIGR01777 family)